MISPQPAARSPQPAARSPQPADLNAPDKIMREIFDHWHDETRWLRAELRRMRPQPRIEDIDDCLIAMVERLINKPPKFQSIFHARYWMRFVCRNLLRDNLRYSRRFRELEVAEGIEDPQEWLRDFNNDDLKQTALAMLEEEEAELLRLYISGFSITRIAEITGIRRTTLQMRFQKIHKFLKESL